MTTVRRSLSCNAEPGFNRICLISDPGVFEFAKPSLIVKESAGKALIPIERSNGCDGKVTLKYRTEDMTAVSGKDFEGGEDTLTFEHGETTKCIEIVVFDDQVRFAATRLGSLTIVSEYEFHSVIRCKYYVQYPHEVVTS